ncbi:MAG: DUF1800 domain-containing protein [Acidobacteria bacterium]|nr:DUF1800 domain-containing protein [Acidobacteriota bacterium]
MRKALLPALVSLLAVGMVGEWLPGAVQNAAQKSKAGDRKPAAKALTEEQRVLHLIERTSFGARPGDVERVRKMGWRRHLDEQMHPERIKDELVEAKLKGIESIHLTNEQIAALYPPPVVLRDALKAKGIDLADIQNLAQGANAEMGPGGASEEQRKMRREYIQAMRELGYRLPQQLVQELQQSKILRAVYSERQLQEVMTDFWFNHFNVFAQKGADRVLVTSYERDAIRPNVFGKFEDLLRATAKSPAMLFYLDNWQSMTPNRQMPARRFGNRRGLNENYAREIMELHTLGVDGGYTQKDVQEVARCLTGWTIRNPLRGGEFVFNPVMHDRGEKVVLGERIAAGGGIEDGEKVIRLLARHPSTAKFISTKLARRFVSDAPPASLVDRMAEVFRKTDGDIGEVLRAMFDAPEFWAAESFRAKIKTPFEMTVSAVRALGAETNGGPQFHRWMAQMGEGLFLAQPPTGYSDTAETWVNSAALLERMNFSLALASGRIPGTRVDLKALDPKAEPKTPTQWVDHYLAVLLHGQVSPQTRSTLDRTLKDAQMDRAKFVGMILGSPEFQRQ